MNILTEIGYSVMASGISLSIYFGIEAAFDKIRSKREYLSLFLFGITASWWAIYLAQQYFKG